MTEDYLTIKELAKRVHLSPKTVYRLCKSGVVKSIQLGGSLRIPKEVLTLPQFTSKIALATPPIAAAAQPVKATRVKPRRKKPPRKAARAKVKRPGKTKAIKVNTSKVKTSKAKRKLWKVGVNRVKMRKNVHSCPKLSKIEDSCPQLSTNEENCGKLRKTEVAKPAEKIVEKKGELRKNEQKDDGWPWPY